MLRLICALALFATGCADQLVIQCRDAHAYTPSTDIYGHTFQATQCADSIVMVVGNLQKP